MYLYICCLFFNDNKYDQCTGCSKKSCHFQKPITTSKITAHESNTSHFKAWVFKFLLVYNVLLKKSFSGFNAAIHSGTEFSGYAPEQEIWCWADEFSDQNLHIPRVVWATFMDFMFRVKRWLQQIIFGSKSREWRVGLWFHWCFLPCEQIASPGVFFGFPGLFQFVSNFLNNVWMVWVLTSMPNFLFSIHLVSTSEPVLTIHSTATIPFFLCAISSNYSDGAALSNHYWYLIFEYHTYRHVSRIMNTWKLEDSRFKMRRVWFVCSYFWRRYRLLKVTTFFLNTLMWHT